MSARTALRKSARRPKAEQLTLDGGPVAVYRDLGLDVEPRPLVRPAPIWWSWKHAARLAAAGWCIGSLVGLAYVVVPLGLTDGLTLDLPFDLVAAGWTVGAVAGTAVGALLGGILGGLLRRFRRWRRWRAGR